MMTDRDTKETKGSFKYIILSGSDGYPPIQKTPGSAGFDVKAPAQVTIPPGVCVKVPLGLRIHPPDGTYTRTALRSGISITHPILIPSDVIDNDYRGPIHCVVANYGTRDVTIEKGERFCQLIFEKYRLVKAEQVDELAPTHRGDLGFGSTGRF